MSMMNLRSLPLVIFTLAASAVQPMSAAQAELVLSELIVELTPTGRSRADIEVWNNSPERAYVAAEPAEILAAGTSGESRRNDPDPERLGLLVSPARMILEPGQRRLLRIAAIGASGERERVYRVTTKPVAGQLSSEASGLKVLIGYDVLVLVRPTFANPEIVASRREGQLTIRNEGNVSVELIDGRACGETGQDCTDLPSKRLYAGAEWSQPISSNATVEYSLKSPGQLTRQRF